MDRNAKKKKVGDFVILEQLGQGQFGTVYLAESSVDYKFYAIKCLNKNFLEGNERWKKYLLTEIAIMKKINHINIIHLYDLLESPNNFYLVLDFCNKGDFEQYLKSRKINCLEEKEAIHFFKQIMNGFRELRKHEVIHRDFKLANLLVDNDIVKIADFGMAKKGHKMAETVVGSYMTMAPELLMINGDNDDPQFYCSKADLWSVGFVFYQILCGEPPFFGLSPNEMFNDIKKKCGNLQFPKDKVISNQAKDLINNLLQMDPKKRIDWPDFFNHPFFDTYFPKSLRDFVQEEAEEMEIVTKPKINKEFIENRISVKNNDKQLDQKDIPSSPKSLNPINIQEIELNENDMKKYNQGQECKLIAKMYSHEKNKILFLVYTVRNIRKIMKVSKNKVIMEELFFTTIYLMKKAIYLNLVHFLSLKNQKNIFNQKGFENFMNSEYFLKVKKKFETDLSNFDQYLQYLINTFDNESLSNESKLKLKKFEDDLNVNEIDQKIEEEYIRLIIQLKYDGNDSYHDYVLMLVSIYYCINCEKFFPYKIGNARFEWDAFYDLHEKMTDSELLKIIK
jgi:serine/threonine protein kinase